MNLRESIKRILREELYSPAGKEITPNKIVVHKSNPMFRDRILEEGLKVKVGECYQIYVNREQRDPDKIKCKPVIFATNSTRKKDWFDSTYDDDVWLIDTKCAGVSWFKDKHYDNDYHIVTFEDISPDCLKLIYKGTGESEDMLQESIRKILREETEYVKDVRVKISDILKTNRDGQSLDDAIVNVQDGLKSYSEGLPFLLKIGDKYEVLDGFHRIAQKILDGKKYIISDVMIKESNMNLQETIRRILREESEIPVFLRRRFDFSMMDRVFEESLDIMSTRYVKHADKWNAMTAKKFKVAVVSDMMQYFQNIMYTQYMNEKIFEEMWGFLMDYYSPQMEEEYYKISGESKQEQNESEITEKCWKGYTQKGMKTMFGKRYPNCVKKTKK